MKTTPTRNLTPLRPEAFAPLPLGSIHPAGWLKDQLTIQATNVTGQLDELWSDLGPDSSWLGGDGECWERGPYYLDGLVPLAYVLDDDKLKAKAQPWIDYTLDHQWDNGWFGHKQAVEMRGHDAWPDAIMLKVLTQYHEATGDECVLPFIERFCGWIRDNADEHPPFEWGIYRWADLALSVHWLYNRTGKEWLLDVAAKVHEQGYDWRGHFEDFKFTEKMAKDKCELKTHVVNNAMAVKTPGIWYVQSDDPADKAAISITAPWSARSRATSTTPARTRRRGPSFAPWPSICSRSNTCWPFWATRRSATGWNSSPTTRCRRRSRRICGATNTTSR